MFFAPNAECDALDRLIAANDNRLMLSVYIIQLNVVGLQAGIDWYTGVLDFRISRENNFLHHGTTVQLEHDQGFRLILHNAKNPAKIDYPRVQPWLSGEQTTLPEP